MLSQKHRDELRASGLSDETIAEARFYTETDPKKIQLILGWKTPASCLGPCLVMPFMNGNGEWDGFARVKPTFPRTSKKKNGELKKVKYEQPAGAGLRVYIPPAARSAVNTDGVMLAITEGEKKSLCATQSGVPTLALCGVEAWGKRLKD
jgi:putative DNA primase/helicase